jgi:hypothetical protein
MVRVRGTGRAGKGAKSGAEVWPNRISWNREGQVRDQYLIAFISSKAIESTLRIIESISRASIGKREIACTCSGGQFPFGALSLLLMRSEEL